MKNSTTFRFSLSDKYNKKKKGIICKYNLTNNKVVLKIKNKKANHVKLAWEAAGDAEGDTLKSPEYFISK